MMRFTSCTALILSTLRIVSSSEEVPKAEINFDEGYLDTYENVEIIAGSGGIKSRFSPSKFSVSNDLFDGTALTARSVVDVLLNRRQQCDADYGYCANFGRCCPTNTLCCQYGYCLEEDKICCPSAPCDGDQLCCGQSHCSPLGGDCCQDESYCEPGNKCFSSNPFGQTGKLCCTDKYCTAHVENGRTIYATSTAITKTLTGTTTVPTTTDGDFTPTFTDSSPTETSSSNDTGGDSNAIDSNGGGGRRRRKTPVGAIIGGVIGGIAVLVLLISGIITLVRRRKNRNNEKIEPTSPDMQQQQQQGFQDPGHGAEGVYPPVPPPAPVGLPQHSSQPYFAPHQDEQQQYGQPQYNLQSHQQPQSPSRPGPPWQGYGAAAFVPNSALSSPQDLSHSPSIRNASSPSVQHNSVYGVPGLAEQQHASVLMALTKPSEDHRSGAHELH